MNPSRRSFLIEGIRVSALAAAFPGALAARPSVSRAGPARHLVVVQLTGGNDGLNTVVPWSQDAYYRSRPFLGLARNSLHRLDDGYALHPQMGGLAQLYHEGRMAVVHGVGSPEDDRSHFRSLEVWHTAQPFVPAGEVGWLGRIADSIVLADGGSAPALAIGGGNLPLSMRGEQCFPPMVDDPRGFRANGLPKGLADLRGRIARGPSSAPDAAPELDFLRRAASGTYAAAARMEAITDTNAGDRYPNDTLAQELRLVASLIAGGFGTRIFHLELGGFDTHARQAPVHADLLRRLSGALTAFQRDLEEKGVAERVLTVAFSEFGRRAAENGSRGTDHGRGAPLFLLGSGVAGGQHGTPPDLDALVEGDVPVTTDFRAIYASLSEEWMSVRPSASPVPPLPGLLA